MDSSSLVDEVVVTEVCHEGESTLYMPHGGQRAAGFLLAALAGAACLLLDLPLIALSILALLSIAAAQTGIWSVFAYRVPSAVLGALVPSDFDPSLGVHGANSTDGAARKHVQ
jgi:hypothetical protein